MQVGICIYIYISNMDRKTPYCGDNVASALSPNTKEHSNEQQQQRKNIRKRKYRVVIANDIDISDLFFLLS